MAASNRTLLIASGAFAAGIAGTVLVGVFRDRPAEVAPPAPQSTWADPVKAPKKVAADATARPPLRFQPEEAKEAAAAPTPLPPERPSTVHAAADAEPVGEAEAPAAPVRRRVVRERGEIRTAYSGARERPAERPAREPKQRVSSVESGGVMQWLMERR